MNKIKSLPHGENLCVTVDFCTCWCRNVTVDYYMLVQQWYGGFLHVGAEINYTNDSNVSIVMKRISWTRKPRITFQCNVLENSTWGRHYLKVFWIWEINEERFIRKIITKLRTAYFKEKKVDNEKKRICNYGNWIFLIRKLCYSPTILRY